MRIRKPRTEGNAGNDECERRRRRRHRSAARVQATSTLIITCVNLILHSGSAIQMLNYIGSWFSRARYQGRRGFAVWRTRSGYTEG